MLKIEVTNNGAVLLGRAGYSFAPGEPKTVEVSASRVDELAGHPDLSCAVAYADYREEIPEGVPLKPDAVIASEQENDGRSGEGGAVTGPGFPDGVIHGGPEDALGERAEAVLPHTENLQTGLPSVPDGNAVPGSASTTSRPSEAGEVRRPVPAGSEEQS